VGAGGIQYYHQDQFFTSYNLLYFASHEVNHPIFLALSSCLLLDVNTPNLGPIIMKSSLLHGGAEFGEQLETYPSSGIAVSQEESPITIPPHPLGVKPSGNSFTAMSNARHALGEFQRLPDEALALFLEYLDSSTLTMLGSTCKALYAFCRLDELWKVLFIG